MEIKDYWDEFYKKNIVLKSESDFAKSTLKYIEEKNLHNNKLIDVACGNGRDTFYFSRNGIQSTGIDISVHPKADNPIFLKENILTFDYSNFQIIYLRFIIHALKEVDLDKLLKRLKLAHKDQYLFIETRSSKGITDKDKSETFFKSSVGEEHFRMLYSESYLTKKLNNFFHIEKVEENKGFSIYKNEDPVCIRYILKSKK